MPALNTATLATFASHPSSVSLPRYRRDAVHVGVVHLGLGAFHRAHQAMVFDRLLQDGNPRWGVLGVAMRSTELADALKLQDGLYAVQVASAEGLHWQVVGSLCDTCVAAREPGKVVAALAAPATRWVTLTVTEKGYGPALAELLVQGLAARRAAGLDGLTVASCDNLSDNGSKLQRLCLDVAAQQDTALAGWIASRCAFPNSMVDRIVPAATARQRTDAALAFGLDDAGALATEAFWEWVMEDRFADPSDAAVMRAVGVNVVEDVKPFEEAKLRMLNGSHTAMALLGAVQGWPTVADGVARPDVRQFVHGLMTQMVMPHLQRPDLPAYRDALLARFANPALQHKVHQIATDSSLKIPLRWLPTLNDNLQAGQGAEPLAFAAAIWMRYLLAEDEQDRGYAISDPQAEALQTLARAHRGDAQGTVQALLGVASIWGEALLHEERWTRRVTHWLARIQAVGAGAALVEVNALALH
ncbi:mannitol dehydrogenase [Rhodoferax koreense]|uniref:Mannitol dehydrogenase n=1 Tax=Rhodoferax koreensis TaxID=1842727 RepID=A0A1P8JWC9_9BURK|nr:mannitol dehydrogenase family protein [Rhodoferax koreense]APW38038.1 mannitol dehydrogenase [Rhodoferax koreense]